MNLDQSDFHLMTQVDLRVTLGAYDLSFSGSWLTISTKSGHQLLVIHALSIADRVSTCLVGRKRAQFYAQAPITAARTRAFDPSNGSIACAWTFWIITLRQDSGLTSVFPYLIEFPMEPLLSPSYCSARSLSRVFSHATQH